MLPSRADESPGAADGRGVRVARAATGWPDHDTPGTAMTPTPRGLYAITPDDLDPERLAGQVARVLEGGVDWLQFRVKGGAPAQREALARRIKALCDAAGVPMVVNDDVALAIAIDAAGVHVGRDDGDPAAIRARLPRGKVLGVSCYDDPARARSMLGVADHVGFGSVFASPTKPQAVRAPLSLFRQARAMGLPAVAIGGIDRRNAALPIEAGADAVAVITDLFADPDPARAARELRAIVHAALARRGG